MLQRNRSLHGDIFTEIEQHEGITAMLRRAIRAYEVVGRLHDDLRYTPATARHSEELCVGMATKGYQSCSWRCSRTHGPPT